MDEEDELEEEERGMAESWGLVLIARWDDAPVHKREAEGDKKENSDVTVMAPTTPGTSVNELLPTCCGAQWGVCLNAAVQCGHCQQLSLVDAQLGHVLVSPHVLSSALLDRGTGVKVKDLDGWTVKGGKERGRSRRGQSES